ADAITEGTEQAFLYGTAMRIASNARRVDRRAQTRRAEATIESVESKIDTRPSPEEVHERNVARAALDGVLETMTVELREVFTLFEH
ncbi:MAG: polymerase sigma factor RpoE, partial [Labilithrix sp.]|nr:polymerase sigma factor RpoE [Labilithrix sp.]